MAPKNIQKKTVSFVVTFGGWYQRTTLHLSEIYELLAHGRSNLVKLSAEKVSEFHRNLNLISVEREVGYLEFVHAQTRDGIEIRYYEDGLYILEIKSNDIEPAQKKLEDYYKNFFSPAIAYIFSLGAPTPRVLANIQSRHPTVIYTNNLETKNKIDFSKFGEIYSQITSADLSVYKTPKYIFIESDNHPKNISELIEMQIFFREFKDQLERYLQIHRDLWEEISDIKEQKSIKGEKIEEIRNKLDSYQKTINLISNRINQMSTYVATRASISEKLGLSKKLLAIFQYKFETLTNTHEYIKEIWDMTSDYLDNAIQIIVEMNDKVTANSIDSLRIVSTVGVMSGLLGYFASEQFPSFTFIGLWYFIFLIIATLVINQIIKIFFEKRRYQLDFGEETFIK